MLPLELGCHSCAQPGPKIGSRAGQHRAPQGPLPLPAPGSPGLGWPQPRCPLSRAARGKQKHPEQPPCLWKGNERAFAGPQPASPRARGFYISSPREQRAGQGGWWEGEAAGWGACADSRSRLVSCLLPSVSILHGQNSTQELTPPRDNPWSGAWGKDLLQGQILPRSPRAREGWACRSGDEDGQKQEIGDVSREKELC